ncbi:MAG: pitrilysin family protein [Lysobacteraceae bacterium]|nr:pitrilysin family protein [Xanthomonadaceae bacterium]HRX99167.1 pitrilysin family protein [Xanthomonadaceae bacterium]
MKTSNRINLINKLLLATAVSLAFAAGSVAARDVELPKQLPAYAKDKALPVADIAQLTLDNGMQVWVVPRDGVPRVDFVLAIKDAGNAVDDADHPGFADLFAGLLTEGTAKRDSRAIAEAAQGMGGGIGASASMDGLNLRANALPSHAGDMLSLLAEVAREPSFPENEVQLAQANALQSLKVSETQPGFRAERALGKILYGDHPYARTEPTEQAITSVSVDMLKQEHARRIRPEHALLVITGRVDKDQGFAMAKKAFGDWKGMGEAPANILPARREAKPSYVLLKRDGSVQSALRVAQPAIPATDPDYVPLSMTRTVLGGGFSSRLMQNLREEKGYTYGAYESARSYASGGALIAGADVRNEVTGDSLKEIMGEFQRIGSEPVGQKELDMNKRYVAGGYLITNQLQGAVAGTLANNWVIGLPPEFLAQYVPMIQKVTPEQIMAMGKKYFDPKNQSIVVVGDPSQVSEQLVPYGEFSVEE